MHRIEEVRALSDYKVWMKFSDGVEGVVDLSDLVGKGIFAQWQDRQYFIAVHVDRESHTIAWPGGIDLCPDALYSEITGKNTDSSFKAKLVSSQ